jgi:hypothetical protein
MGWLFAIAILILLVVSTGFRKFTLAIVALATVAGGVYYFHSKHQEELAKSRIPAAQVAISNGRINLKYSTYHFTGRIANNSAKYTLTQVALAITARDCASDSAPQSCVTIGETNETMYINVPPGQARDFDETLYFSGGGLTPKGSMVWQYKVSQTRASPDNA